MKRIIADILRGYVGLLFPLIMVVILLQKMHHLLYPLVQLIEAHLHVSHVLGMLGIILISIFLMLLLGYLAGLLLKSAFIRKEVAKFEEKVLNKIPIYSLAKSVFNTSIGSQDKNRFLPAMISDPDSQSFSLCYVTDESENFYTAYICDGGLGGGELRIVPKKVVKLLDIHLMEFTKLIKQYGVNSAYLVEQASKSPES